jgi:hypothetical protein
MVVEECWRGQEISGWMGFVIKEKLGGLKTRLKEWSQVEYGGFNTKVKDLSELINNLDIKSESLGGWEIPLFF